MTRTLIAVTDEMIEKGREAREEHYLRVSPVACTCGWKSDTYIEADGLPRFEAHLVDLALTAVLPGVIQQAKAEAWDEGAEVAWGRSTPEVNGARYHWRSAGEPVNPYEQGGQP